MNEEEFYHSGEFEPQEDLQFNRRNFLKVSGAGLFIFFAPGTFFNLVKHNLIARLHLSGDKTDWRIEG